MKISVSTSALDSLTFIRNLGSQNSSTDALKPVRPVQSIQSVNLKENQEDNIFVEAFEAVKFSLQNGKMRSSTSQSSLQNEEMEAKENFADFILQNLKKGESLTESFLDGDFDESEAFVSEAENYGSFAQSNKTFQSLQSNLGIDKITQDTLNNVMLQLAEDQKATNALLAQQLSDYTNAIQEELSAAADLESQENARLEQAQENQAANQANNLPNPIANPQAQALVNASAFFYPKTSEDFRQLFQNKNSSSSGSKDAKAYSHSQNLTHAVA